MWACIHGICGLRRQFYSRESYGRNWLCTLTVTSVARQRRAAGNKGCDRAPRSARTDPVPLFVLPRLVCQSTTKESETRGLFACRGDIAGRDSDGFYCIVGRSKDMYISGGVNIYAADVEAGLFRPCNSRRHHDRRSPHLKRSTSFSEQLINFPGELSLEFLGAVVTGMH